MAYIQLISLVVGSQGSEVRDRRVKQERKEDHYKDVRPSWPTLPATRCSITLSDGLPTRKREKKHMSRVSQGLPKGAF